MLTKHLKDQQLCFPTNSSIFVRCLNSPMATFIPEARNHD
jgi:hypothetical protein